MKYKIGDKVKIEHYDFTGVITHTHAVCPMSTHWLALQEYPFRRSNRVNWYTVDTYPYGQIVYPEHMIRVPWYFKNSHSNKKCVWVKNI